MSPDAQDFYGKDVASAIKEACDTFGVAQENLNIEVIETGSTGIFGLIRKKAHIRVDVQPEEAAAEEPPRPKQKAARARAQQQRQVSGGKTAEAPAETAPEPLPDRSPEVRQTAAKPVSEPPDEDDADDDENGGEPVELSAESLELVRRELLVLLELMDCPSEVEVSEVNGTAHCQVAGEYEADLTGQEGRTLDSLQYLLRKIVSRKVSGKLRVTIDVGDYRERRHLELRDKALDYAAQVKQNGKTQVIPSLNPSERRVVHVALQDDGEIRSRSVGEGLFKKVLIYKPGKGKKPSGGRRRGRGKPRKKSDSSP